jgi:hypothetical protein
LYEGIFNLSGDFKLDGLAKSAWIIHVDFGDPAGVGFTLVHGRPKDVA